MNVLSSKCLGFRESFTYLRNRASTSTGVAYSKGKQVSLDREPDFRDVCELSTLFPPSSQPASSASDLVLLTCLRPSLAGLSFTIDSYARLKRSVSVNAFLSSSVILGLL